MAKCEQLGNYTAIVEEAKTMGLDKLVSEYEELREIDANVKNVVERMKNEIMITLRLIKM